MASKKLRRFVHFANLPLRMLLPESLDNIKEVAFKTVPCTSKIEVKRAWSLFMVKKSRNCTLSMEGKKKLNRKTGNILQETRLQEVLRST